MDESVKEMRSHAWQYFAIHASQRMSMFNFFLVLAGLVAAGLAACLQGKGVLQILGCVLGGFLAAVAFVFYKLDGRMSFFVKHAEAALVRLEADFEVEEARLFSAEIPATTAGSLRPSLHRMWTYGYSLRVIFAITGLAGLAASILSLARYIGWIA